MTHRSHLLALLAPVLLAPAALAGTVTVCPLGSGATYVDIADAIAAALPGDTVLVAAGDYDDTTPLVIDKPLTLLGAGSSLTSFRAQGAVAAPLPLKIVGLQAGQEVRVAGLSLSSQLIGGYGALSVVVQDCDGPVVLADLVRGGPTPTLASPGMVQVHGSAQVLIDGCSFDPGDSSGMTTPGLLVVNSKLYVNNSTVTGGDAISGLNPFNGAPALLASGSEVRVSRSQLRGGNGTNSSSFAFFPAATSGGNAISATDSLVFVRGGAGNLLLGGTGGYLLNGGAPLVGAGGVAIELDASSLISTTSDANYLAGLSGTGALPPVWIKGTGGWFQAPRPLATVELATALVAPGSTAQLNLGGEVGSTFFTYFGKAQVPPVSVPGVFGEILLSPSAALPMATVSAGALSEATLMAPVQNVASLVGKTFLIQTIALEPSGEVSFSAPAFIGVR